MSVLYKIWILAPRTLSEQAHGSELSVGGFSRASRLRGRFLQALQERATASLILESLSPRPALKGIDV